MPAEIFGPGHAFLRDPQLMSRDEIIRLARAFQQLGVNKIRLTGGEPLLRTDLPEIIRQLKTAAGIQVVALTTNGWLLEKLAPELRAAGVDRINVSKSVACSVASMLPPRSACRSRSTPSFNGA
jgi:cyclic pyranopterin phosphate synthase